MRDEIVPDRARAALGKALVVAWRAEPVRVSRDLHGIVVSAADLPLEAVECSATIGREERAVELEKGIGRQLEWRRAGSELGRRFRVMNPGGLRLRRRRRGERRFGARLAIRE